MRRGGHQLTLRAQRGLELSEHGVEARPEAAQLISALGRDTPREVACLGHLFDGGGQPLYGGERRPPYEGAEGGRQKDRACREGDEKEAGLSERRIDPGLCQVLHHLDRATALD